ncbi:MGMT family protein [Legionella brunensis]|uniref:Methylated-DNA--protein-cysteine methyltransferase n=1 Tax=Legionella brunensis TaxID=29422 RepID=A0A0W0SD48_9GAMM|nr:MGMT family protein [Legionella brunensis]KTC81319.1 methylated-DNA--protein-cysteine methyltransferase [Legionella brunensis]
MKKTNKDTQTEFSKKVLELIKAIPKGKVATYGLIAGLAGNRQGARGVGWLLHSCAQSHNLPWQRVIKSNGQLSFPLLSNTYSLQKNLLESEGVTVLNGRVDLKEYLWEFNTK